MSQPESLSQNPFGSGSSSSPTPSVRLLVIDDDPATAQAVASCLPTDTPRIDQAANSDAIRAALNGPAPDLIVLELNTAHGQGFDILNQIHAAASPAAPPIPVLILSSWQDTPHKIQAFNQGVLDYVTKPFDPAELGARIQAALKIKWRQDQAAGSLAQLEAARLAAEKSTRTKAGFLANMSHEIRTPMNGVIAMTGLLQQTDLSHEQRDFVETIRASGESLLAIINEILNYSKLEAGKMELECRPLNLRSCIEETLDMVASKASEKSLDLLYQIAPGTPSIVIGDMTRLRQVLVNLVGNAVKFTSHGEVCVHVTSRALKPPVPVSVTEAEVPRDPEAPPPRWEIQFTVRDTGIGIPTENQARLFQTYSQADNSITRKFGGTGLGLAISKGLVELMGGRMWVESQPGVGSHFHFTVSSPESQSADTSFTRKTVRDLADLQVLVVEDNDASRTILSEQLERWGMKPVSASSAKAAIDLCRSGRKLDAALVEMDLPPTDGQQLAKTIRSLPGHAALPIVLVTTLGKRPDFSDLLSPDNTSHLAKPIKPEALQSALLKILSKTPLATPRDTPQKPGRRAEDSLASRFPMRILVTDDNLINQKVASRLLSQLGYQADIAKSGREAIQALERTPYDLVFMDVQMPEMNGLEATARIREFQRVSPPQPHFNRPIAIIAMTANAMHGDREKCLAAGMDDYIAKPVRSDTLQRMLTHFGNKMLQTGQSTPPPGENVSDPASPAIPASQGSPVPSADSPMPPASLPTLQTHEDPVDLDRLFDFSGGSTENLEEIITLYLQQTAGQLEQMQAAHREGKPDTIGNVAHSCAGASATCGMRTLVPLLRRLELAGKTEDLPASGQILQETSLEFQRVKLYLETKPWTQLNEHDIPRSIAI